MAIGALVSNIGSQIWAISEALTGIGNYKLEKRKLKNEAISSMRKALNRTRMFLKDPDFSNQNEIQQISDLWNEASEKVGILNTHLGEMLGMKSRFWSDHELFIALGRDKEVMSLNDVVSEIDKLYNKM